MMEIQWLLLCSLVVGFSTVNGQHNLSLVQVQVITRHGARTPFQDLPQSDYIWNCDLTELSRPDHLEVPKEEVARIYRKRYLPARETLPGNCSQGQLTIVGYEGHRDLGIAFRKRYIDQLGFLNHSFDSKEFYIRSTDSPRTIASAQSQLLGFYPPSYRSCSASVFDIFTIEPANENLVSGMRCPTMVQLCNGVSQSAAWMKKEASLNSLKLQLESIWNVSSLPWWIGLFDAFYSRSFHNVPLPNGITQAMVTQVTDLVVWELNYLYGTPNIAKLGIGTFMLELQEQIQHAMNGRVNPKWIFYSAHDTTLALILSSLNSLEGRGWPPYVGHLLFELYKDNAGDFYVHLIYNGGEVVVPGCSTAFCKVDTFFQILSAVALSPQVWSRQCGIQGTTRSAFSILTSQPSNVAEYFC